MSPRQDAPSELRKVFLFVGILVVLLVGSFFVGMFLGGGSGTATTPPKTPTVALKPSSPPVSPTPVPEAETIAAGSMEPEHTAEGNEAAIASVKEIQMQAAGIRPDLPPPTEPVPAEAGIETLPEPEPIAAEKPLPKSSPKPAPDSRHAAPSVKAAKAEPSKPATPSVKPSAAPEKIEKKPEGKITFAVQVGAFKDEAEAKKLADKLTKNGYPNVAVAAAEARGGVTLHKVRVGRFTGRDEAEALSTKIRQKEGIQAFVTFR